MPQEEGRIYYSLGIDNTQLRADADKAMNQFRNIGNTVESEGDRMDGVFKRIGAGVAAAFTIGAATNFVKNIVRVTGEFESLQISLETLLGSKERADEMFNSMHRFAATTPLLLNDLAKGAQTLLAFNVEADRIMPTLKQIGDISMGDSRKLQSLTLAFSQMSSTGKLTGQDLLQMINAGFNPLSVMAEKTGKSMSKLKDEMAKGAISSDMVAKAFADAAAEGGKFYGMLEKQSKGIQGSISNLKGAIDDMLSDIGEGQKGIITGAINGATSVVQDYKKIGEALAVVISSYGAYKAAIIATEAVKRTQETIRYTEEANQLIKLIDVEKAAELQKIKLAQGNKAYVDAVIAETQARVAGAQATLAAAREDVAASAQALTARRAEYIAAKENLKVRTQELAVAKQSGTAKEVEIAQRNLNASATRKEAAAVAFQTAARDKAAKTIAVETAAKTANTERTAVNTATQVAATRATNIFTAAQTRLTIVWQRLNAVIMNNPLMLIAAALTLVTYGVYKLVTADDAATKAQKKVNAEMEKAKKTTDELRGKIDSLTSTIKDQTASLYERVAAFRELQKETPDLYKDMSFEQFSKLSPEEQKERENQFFDKKSIEDLNKAIDDQRKRITDYERVIRDQFRNPSGGSDGIIAIYTRRLEGARAELKVLEDQQKQQRENLETANELEKAQENIPSLSEAQSLALKQYNDAKKLVDEILANASDYTKKQFSDAVDAMNVAKKEAESVGLSFDDPEVEKKEKRDFSQQIESEKQNRIRAIQDLELSVRQSQIDGMNEGANKVIEQNKLNHDRRVEELKRQQEDLLKQIQDSERTIWESQNQDADKTGATFTPSTLELPADVKAKFDALIADANKQLKSKNKDVLEVLAKDYGDYQQKRAALTREWERKIAEIPVQYQEGARQQMNDALADLDDRYGRTASAIENLFNRARNQSRDTLREIVNEAKRLEQALKNNEFSESFGLTKEQFERLRNTPEEMDRLGQAIHRADQKAKKADDTIVRLGRSFEKLWKSKPGTDEAMENLDEFQDSLGEILAVSNEITGSLSDMFDAIGGDSMADALGGINNVVQGLGQAGGGIAQIMSGDPKQLLSGITNTISGIGKTFTSIFKIGDKSKERAIQRLQVEYDTIDTRIKRIEWNISDLQGKINSSFGSTKASLIGQSSKEIEQENAKLRQQINIINQQIKSEENKKKTNKGRIEDWKNDIADINRQIELNNQEIEKNKELQVDALFGNDIKSAINDFADAYANAWAAGTDKAKNMKNVVRDLMRSYVMEMIKADDGLQWTIENLRKNIDNYLKDGVLDDAEKASLEMMAQLESDRLDRKYSDIMGVFQDDEQQKRQGTSKGFQSMSQDSADELNGRFAALQAYTLQISDSMKLLSANSSEALKYLSGIESNTSHNKRLDEIDANTSSMKRSLQEMNQRGITIRN